MSVKDAQELAAAWTKTFPGLRITNADLSKFADALAKPDEAKQPHIEHCHDPKATGGIYFCDERLFPKPKPKCTFCDDMIAHIESMGSGTGKPRIITKAEEFEAGMKVRGAGWGPRDTDRVEVVFMVGDKYIDPAGNDHCVCWEPFYYVMEEAVPELDDWAECNGEMMLVTDGGEGDLYWLRSQDGTAEWKARDEFKILAKAAHCRKGR